MVFVAFQMCYDAIIMCLLEDDFDICIGLLIIHVELIFHIYKTLYFAPFTFVSVINIDLFRWEYSLAAHYISQF